MVDEFIKYISSTPSVFFIFVENGIVDLNSNNALVYGFQLCMAIVFVERKLGIQTSEQSLLEQKNRPTASLLWDKTPPKRVSWIEL